MSFFKILFMDQVELQLIAPALEGCAQMLHIKCKWMQGTEHEDGFIPPHTHTLTVKTKA